jgi:lysozyme family protein
MADFNEAIPVTLENEGGLIDSPGDPGGLTKYGISQRSYPNVDIRNLTVEGAKAIYLRDFWKFDGIVSQPVATKIFDMYVLAEHNAIKALQDLLFPEPDGGHDGIYGPATEKAVNAQDPASLLQRYRNEMVDYYLHVAEENPAEAKYLKGWLNRARQ